MICCLKCNFSKINLGNWKWFCYQKLVLEFNKMLSDDYITTSEHTALTVSTILYSYASRSRTLIGYLLAVKTQPDVWLKILSVLVFHAITASRCRFYLGTNDDRLRWRRFQSNPLFRLEKTIAYEGRGKVVPSVYVDGFQSSFFDFSILLFSDLALYW